MASPVRPNERNLVHIPAGPVTLEGNLEIPERAIGVVLFAHGSGSSRLSSRNRFVASALNHARIGTLLFDLLTREEGVEDNYTGRLRFDVDLLARRLAEATRWLRQQEQGRDLPLGYFGASTGAAAALVAAADRGEEVRAIVSRGGRPDLAGRKLQDVKSPTLLIVGEADVPVIALNEAALKQLQGPKKLEIVPRATHLFEEPGALERVAELARRWFETHLAEKT